MLFAYKLYRSKWIKNRPWNIKSSTCEKLLGIKIDKLRLKAHVEDLCKKASRKIHAPARFTQYMAVMKYTPYI